MIASTQTSQCRCLALSLEPLRKSNNCHWALKRLLRAIDNEISSLMQIGSRLYWSNDNKYVHPFNKIISEKNGMDEWLMMDGQQNNLKAAKIVVDTNNRWRWDNRHDCPQRYSLIDWTTESHGWRCNGYKILMENIGTSKSKWSWTRLWHGTLEQSSWFLHVIVPCWALEPEWERNIIWLFLWILALEWW